MDNLKAVKQIYILSLILVLVISELVFNMISIRYFEDEMLNTIYKQNNKQLDQVFELIRDISSETESQDLLKRLYLKIAKKSYKGSDSFVCFLDSTGTIIAHGDPNMIGKSMKEAKIEAKDGIKPFTGDGTIINGEVFNKGYASTEIISSQYNNELKLNISIHENRKILEERISEFRQQFFILGITLFIFLLLIGLYFGNKIISNSLEQIAKYQRKILEDNKKLLILNEQLDDYSTIVSHDVASPLSIISMSIDVLKMKLDSKARVMVEPYIEKISVAVSSIKDLTQNLLKISKIMENKYELEIIDLNEIVNSVKKMFESSSVSIELIKKLPKIHADKSQVEVVFNNLINNGLKYNDSIYKTVQVGYDDQEAKIFIKDNGIGIPEQDLDKIFQKFFRSSNKGSREGHGVGLHMVKKIIEKMNAKIFLNSTVGEGTTFIIQLGKMHNLKGSRK